MQVRTGDPPGVVPPVLQGHERLPLHRIPVGGREHHPLGLDLRHPRPGEGVHDGRPDPFRVVHPSLPSRPQLLVQLDLHVPSTDWLESAEHRHRPQLRWRSGCRADQRPLACFDRLRRHDQHEGRLLGRATGDVCRCRLPGPRTEEVAEHPPLRRDAPDVTRRPAGLVQRHGVPVTDGRRVHRRPLSSPRSHEQERTRPWPCRRADQSESKRSELEQCVRTCWSPAGGRTRSTRPAPIGLGWPSPTGSSRERRAERVDATTDP